jgi:hypothetical protein
MRGPSHLCHSAASCSAFGRSFPPAIRLHAFGLRSNIEDSDTFKTLHNVEQPSCADAVLAGFILLKLLGRDAQGLREVCLAHLEYEPTLAYLSANISVNGGCASGCGTRRRRADMGAIKAQQPRTGNRPMAWLKKTAPARGCARAAIPRMPMGGGHPVFISQASPPPLVPSRVLGRPKFLHG